MKDSVIDQENLDEGEIQNQIEVPRQILRKMLEYGLALDLITKVTGLTLTEIQATPIMFDNICKFLAETFPTDYNRTIPPGSSVGSAE